MTVNHLPTELRTVTDQSVGLFSSAEGFVFISGLMAGWVYTSKVRKYGREALAESSLGRSKSIYLWHIGSFLAAFALVQITAHYLGYCSVTAPRLFFERPLASLGLGLSLLYQPGLLDLLPMYCAFVLTIPLVIRALEAGRRWTVLGISAAVWLAVQWAPAMGGPGLYPINTGTFNLFAWQFIFIAGIAIGHARFSGEAQVARPSAWVLAAASALVIYCAGIRYHLWPSVWPEALFGVLLNKPALGLLRMADFGCFALLVAVLGARFPRLLVARPLAFLGRHSLPVVAAQSVAIVVLLQFAPLFATPLSRTLTAVGAVALLFAAAGAQEWLFPGPERARAIETRQSRRRRVLRTHGARAA